MAEEITPTPNPAPAPTPAAQPAPAANPEVEKKAQAQAEYLARHPDVLDSVLQQLEQAGAVKVNQRVDQLERELALRDVISETGLPKEAMILIQASTREEMLKKAEALKALTQATVTQQTVDTKTVIKAGTMGMQPGAAPQQPPPLKETVPVSRGVPSVDAATDALFKAMEKISFES